MILFFTSVLFFFFFNDTATTEIYTLSLHDALPILRGALYVPLDQTTRDEQRIRDLAFAGRDVRRSEEHTSELQSQSNLVCRLLLEKKKTYRILRSTRSSTTRPPTSPLDCRSTTC